MKRLSAIAGVLAVAIVAIVIAAAASGGSTATPGAGGANTARSGATVLQGQGSRLGRLLTDGHGRVLYLFEADTRDRSHLSRAGFALWPAFEAGGNVRVKGGAAAAMVRTIPGPGGKRQVTYDHHPLYYYAGDTKPGQTHGQGLDQFGAKWYVVTPSGRKIDDD
jgi:predicted lipoprotein with Yx(FWY)xxD motif